MVERTVELPRPDTPEKWVKRDAEETYQLFERELADKHDRRGDLILEPGKSLVLASSTNTQLALKVGSDGYLDIIDYVTGAVQDFVVDLPDVDGLEAEFVSVRSEFASADSTLSAAITAEASARATADSAEASLREALEASVTVTTNALKQAAIPETFEEGVDNLTASVTGAPSSVTTLATSANIVETTGDGRPVVQVTGNNGYYLKNTLPVLPNQVWELEVEFRSTVADAGKNRIFLFAYGLGENWATNEGDINDGADVAADVLEQWYTATFRFTNDSSLSSDPSIDVYDAMTDWKHLRPRIVHNAVAGTGTQQIRAVRFRNVTGDTVITAAIENNQSAIATETSARAAADSTLTASINGVSATVTTQGEAIADIEGNLVARYAIAVDGGGGGAFISLEDGTSTPGTITLSASEITLDGDVIITGTFTRDRFASGEKEALTAEGLAANYYEQSGDPAPVANGSLWFRTSTNELFIRRSGSWGKIANIAAATTFTASYSASPVNNSGSGSTFSTGSISINTSGLTGSKIYSTEIISSSNLTPKVSVVNPTNVSFTLQATGFSVSESETGVVRSIVTDTTTGTTTVVQAAYSMTRTS